MDVIRIPFKRPGPDRDKDGWVSAECLLWRAGTAESTGACGGGCNASYTPAGVDWLSMVPRISGFDAVIRQHVEIDRVPARQRVVPLP